LTLVSTSLTEASFVFLFFQIVLGETALQASVVSVTSGLIKSAVFSIADLFTSGTSTSLPSILPFTVLSSSGISSTSLLIAFDAISLTTSHVFLIPCAELIPASFNTSSVTFQP
tara:strand:+ start:1405 stop:1746 length:342 start_codon:yes stop_codon:yes gene_type:complete